MNKEKQECIDFLKNTLNKGDTIYTQLYKKTRNGTIYIDLRYIKDNSPFTITYHYSKIMEHKLDKNNFNTIRQRFGNMDMGFWSVYNLCHKVWDNGYYCKHEWL
jgi:hypothetical protein